MVTISCYWRLFHVATKRASVFGFENEVFTQSREPILTPKHGLAVMAALRKQFHSGELKSIDLAFKRAEINLKMKAILEEITQVKAMLTLGGVSNNGKLIWSAESPDLSSLRDSGNYHVWLTLCTGEIVDLALMPALYLYRGMDPSKAQPIAVVPSDQGSWQWVPKLVGDEPVRRLLNPRQ